MSFRFAAPVPKVPLRGQPVLFVYCLFGHMGVVGIRSAGKKIKGDREGDRSFYTHPIGEPDQERAGEAVVVGGDKPSVRAGLFLFFLFGMFFLSTTLWSGFISFLLCQCQRQRFIAQHSIA